MRGIFSWDHCGIGGGRYVAHACSDGMNPTPPPASCGTWGPHFNPSGCEFRNHYNGGRVIILQGGPED